MTRNVAADSNWLQLRWQDLTSRHAGDAEAARRVGAELLARYAEPQRRYHGLGHVEALLRLLEGELTLVHEHATVAYAIWFHDAVYDPRAHDNEEQSAALARRAMQEMALPRSLIDAVETCVLATRGHQLTSGDVVDLPVFLDLDLSILAAPEPDYENYRRQIRAEYEWVPEPVYRNGRARLLAAFLERPRLYFTPALAARWEECARSNMARELQELQGGHIPDQKT